MDFGLRVLDLSLGLRSKMTHEQNVIIFQFYVRTTHAEFRALRLNNEEKVLRGINSLIPRRTKVSLFTEILLLF